MEDLYYEHCTHCEMELHLCPGCGEPITHGENCCSDCREAGL